MAMEFGASGELAGEAENPPPAELYSGGFELVEEAASAPAGAASRREEAPSFAEEPIELSGTAPAGEEEIEIVALDADESESESESESEPAIELSLDGVEPPLDESAEIVLEAEAGADGGVLSTDVEVIGLGEGGAGEGEGEGEGGMEVIAFDVESEPEVAPEGVESLIGALGEDIDSLIDSIIDDVGSSARGKEPTREPPPTHIPLFSDLTTSEFIAVAILLVRRVAKVGEVIVREGDPGDSMFIVSTGEVRATVLRDRQQVPVATLRDGDFFGEMAVLSGEPRTATVTAVKATELLELSRENLREICSRHPEVEAKIRLAYDERIARSAAQRR
jgi:hypothetical protein